MTSGRQPPNGDTRSGREDDSSSAERLLGWKAIASYLGRDIRTVQRWELQEQLPIHRLEHQRQGSAYAYKAELDEWQKRRSSNPSQPGTGPAGQTIDSTPTAAVNTRRNWVWGTGAGLLIVVALVGAVFAWRARHAATSGADTQNAQAYAAYAEGKALYASREYHPAVTALERAVTRDPNFGAAWALLAKAHARLAQPVWAGGEQASSRAAESARKAATIAPDSPDTRIALALVARSKGDLVTWRAEAQRAIDLDPRAAEAYALLGDSYSAVIYACNRDQDPERAEAYYRKALELAPDSTIAISNRAGNLRRMGRYNECIELLTNAASRFRDEPPLRATRGACRLMQGDIAGASEDIESLRGSVRLAPAGSLVYFGLLDIKKGNKDQGISELEQAIAASPSSRTHLIVAEAYGSVGDISRSVAHMKQAFTSDPGCAGMVDTSLAFKSVRNAPEVRQLLESYGIR